MELGDLRFVLAAEPVSLALRTAVERHGGVVLRQSGPLVAGFVEVLDAIAAARALQRESSTFLALAEDVDEAAALLRAAGETELVLSIGVAAALGPALPADAKQRDGVVVVTAPVRTPRALRAVLPAPLALLGPFVGRDDERRALLAAWTRATAGERTVAVVEGEAGIGKTRLVADLAAKVVADGGLVLYGHCEQDSRVAHRPLVEALRFYAERVGVEGLVSSLGPHAAELSRLVPELSSRLGMPFRVGEEPDGDHHRLAGAVDAWLTDGSLGQPILLVLDDVQWAPRPTAALITALADSRRPAALLIVLISRHVNDDGTPPRVLTEIAAPAARIVLGPLDAEAVAALADTTFGGPPAPALTDAVLQLTGGHALYVVHLLDHLAVLGVSAEMDEPPGELLNRVGAPSTIQEFIAHRLGQMSDAHRTVLVRAAVLGDRVERELLRGVLDDDSSIDDALTTATELRLVTEESPGVWAFSHSLVRAALSQELSQARRARLHRRAADAIIEYYADDVDPHVAVVADHLVRAGQDDEQTVLWAMRAGEQALHRLAPDDAVRWFRTALSAAGDRADAAVAGELQLRLGLAQVRAGDPAGLSTLIRAGRAAAERDDTEQLVRAALATSRGFFGRLGSVDVDRVELLELALARHRTEDAERARLLALLAHEKRFGATKTQHRELSLAAVALARQFDRQDVLIDALTAHQATEQDPSFLSERLAITEELVQLADRAGDLGERARARWYRADSLMEAGDLTQFAVSAEEAVALAEASGHPLLRWATWHFRVAQLATAGDLAGAEREAAAAHQLGLRLGQSDATLFFGGQLYMVRLEQDRLAELAPLFSPFAEAPDAIAVIVAMQAVIDIAVGDLGAARRRLSALIADNFAVVPRDELWRSTLALCAVAAHALGDVVAAQAVDDALEPSIGGFVFSTAGAIGVTGAVAHYCGLARATLGDTSGAMALFEQARRAHERAGGIAWINRTRLALARVISALDPARAHKLANQAIGDLAGTHFVALQREANRLLGA